jgi:ABC-2 type transport system permease protein
MAQLSDADFRQRQDRSQLLTLFRLRGKLTLRQFSREKGRIIGAIVVLLIFGPLIVAAAIGTATGYRSLENQWPTALLGAVFVAMWFIWLVFPIIATSINESADITRLLIFPISRRDLILSTLLGTLFDYPTYLMLPLLVAAFIGFGFTIAFPVVILAILLSYGHMVLIGQFITVAIGGVLQSRRFRDVAIIVFSLLGSSCYFINLAFQSGIERFTQSLSLQEEEAFAEAFANWQPLNVLQWFPTGAPARAVEQALDGSWLTAVLWLFYSAVLLAGLTWIWFQLMNRLATGGGFLIGGRPQAEKEKRVRHKTIRRSPLDWLPDDLAALVGKELRSAWRIPQRRVGLLQGLLLPVFMMGPFLFSADFSGGVSSLPNWFGLSMPFYALFLFWSTSQNMLAWEGRGLPALLLTPQPRWRLFLAKGIVFLLIAGIPYLIVGIAVMVLLRDWITIFGVLTGLGMGIASLAVTAVASVLFPIPINLEAKRTRGAFQSGGNFKTGCATITLVPISIAVVNLPAAGLLGAAFYFDLPWLAAAGAIFSLVYSVGILYAGSRLAGNLLMEREPELVATMKLPDE